jgi:hypothetical protein
MSQLTIAAKVDSGSTLKVASTRRAFRGAVGLRLGICYGSFKTRPADILAVDCIRNELPLVKETVSRRDVFSIALSRPDQQDGLMARAPNQDYKTHVDVE